MRESEVQTGTRPRLALRAGATLSVRLFAAQAEYGSLPPSSRILHAWSWPRQNETEQRLCYASRITSSLQRGEPSVPILKAPRKQSENEPLQLRISAELKSKLQRYAEFLNATPSYVVTEALDRIFRKDREFRAWLEQHPVASNPTQTEDSSVTETTSKA